MRPAPVSELLLLAGPPFSGQLWRGIQARWAGRLRAEVLDLFDPIPEDPTLDGLAARVAAALAAARVPTGLVAHGTAVPVAIRAAVKARPPALVLSDGPVTRLDPVLAALAAACRMPRLAAETLLRPGFFERWLSSSRGLRRAVVNPYVMDRDTVVALVDPLLRDPRTRLALARFLGSLPAALRSTPRYEGPTLLCWGEIDRLYPARVADEARLLLPGAVHDAIPGAEHLHPEERPWELADRVEAWLQDPATMT